MYGEYRKDIDYKAAPKKPVLYPCDWEIEKQERKLPNHGKLARFFHKLFGWILPNKPYKNPEEVPFDRYKAYERLRTNPSLNAKQGPKLKNTTTYIYQ